MPDRAASSSSDHPRDVRNRRTLRDSADFTSSVVATIQDWLGSESRGIISLPAGNEMIPLDSDPNGAVVLPLGHAGQYSVHRRVLYYPAVRECEDDAG